jgi:hypothetical protein
MKTKRLPSIGEKQLFGHDDIYLTAIGLTPGGSSTVHVYIHTNNTQNTENGTYITSTKAI